MSLGNITCISLPGICVRIHSNWCHLGTFNQYLSNDQNFLRSIWYDKPWQKIAYSNTFKFSYFQVKTVYIHWSNFQIISYKRYNNNKYKIRLNCNMKNLQQFKPVLHKYPPLKGLVFLSWPSQSRPMISKFSIPIWRDISTKNQKVEKQKTVPWNFITSAGRCFLQAIQSNLHFIADGTSLHTSFR